MDKKVRVFFVGVCVHLRDQVPGVSHRVVIINGTSIGHQAKVEFGDVTLPLDGAVLTIANAKSNAVRYDGTFDNCVPRLGNYTKEPLPALSRSMAEGKDQNLAAAYFDASGDLSCDITHNGASVAILDVETNGQPLLRIAPFDGSTPVEYEIPDEIPISIYNTGETTTGDRDEDFLLSFKIAERVPTDAEYPKERMCKPRNQWLPPTNIGAGCSNSAYP